MKKFMISCSGLRGIFISLSILLLAAIAISCDKDDPTSSRAVTLNCEAGCSTMDWDLIGEGGAFSMTSSCTRTYNAFGNYSEDCTGSITFDESGNTYNFTATYDWIDCSVEITVEGVGTCTDQVNNPNLKRDCDCGETSGINRIVTYKEN